MTDEIIEITLEGFPDDGGDALFEVFADQMQNVKNVLNKLNKNASDKTGKLLYKFKIVDLSHNSPATIKILEEFTGDEGTLDKEYRPSYQFGKVIKNPKAANNNTLEYYKKICEDSKKLKAMKITLPNEVYEIDEHRRKVVENIPILKTENKTIYSYISYEGMVEKIDIHDKKNEFFIFPLTGPKSIKCYFVEEIRNKVLEAIGKKACVEGRGVYKDNSNFPNEITVKNINLFQNVDTEKFNFEYFSGTPKKRGDGKNSEELIREIRDEWE